MWRSVVNYVDSKKIDVVWYVKYKPNTIAIFLALENYLVLMNIKPAGFVQSMISWRAMMSCGIGWPSSLKSATSSL